jgi:hypothetical protein
MAAQDWIKSSITSISDRQNKIKAKQFSDWTDATFTLVGYLLIAAGIGLRFSKTTAEILEWHKV